MKRSVYVLVACALVTLGWSFRVELAAASASSRPPGQATSVGTDPSRARSFAVSLHPGPAMEEPGLAPVAAGLFAEQAARERERRRGRVRLDGRSLVDEGGSFLATGATLFWAVWGYEHDRDRLEANLRYLAESGAVDYIRVLGTVGGENWKDRAVDARRPGWKAAVSGLTDLAYDRYGLRVQWTLFGELDFLPTPADRVAAVDGLLEALRGREHKVLLIETANEAWLTGFAGKNGLVELRSLTRRLKAATNILVAATSNHESPGLFCDTYAGGVADIATIHFDRDTGKPDGEWGPVRRPWGYPGDLPCAGSLPPGSSNEPIGAYSSGFEERDPTRLIAQIVVAHLAGLPASVLHAGPGIFGGGASGRADGSPADLWETDRLTETLRGLAAVKALLPEDLSSWRREDSLSGRAPFAPDMLWPASGAGHGAVAVYAVRRGEEFVALAFGIKEHVTLTARWPMNVERIRLASGEIVEGRELSKGESWRLEQGEGAWLLRSARVTVQRSR